MKEETKVYLEKREQEMVAENIKAFLVEYYKLCEKYHLSVGYNSRKGIYQVAPYSQRSAGYVSGRM